MSPSNRSPMQLLALAAALTLATHAVVLCDVGETQAVIWLPSGVAMAGQWLLGWRACVVIALTTIANRMVIGYHLDAAATAGIGSALEAALGVWLLRRAGMQTAFARLRDVLALFVAAAAAPLASITFSWITRYALDLWREPTPFYSRWDSWWRMNALGIVMVVPLVLTWRSTTGASDRPTSRWFLPVLVLTSALMLWTVTAVVPPSPTAIGALYMLLPIPLFGALRLGPRGALIPAAASALLVTFVTAAGMGPFTCEPIDQRHEPLQIFLLATTAVPLVVGSLIAEREAIAAASRGLEDQLRQAQKLDAIGKLAGGVAHDFNNLLTAIIGYAEAARDRLPEGNESRREIGGVLQASQRAAALVRQLLAFSRQQVLSPRVLDLGLVVESVAPMLRRLLGERVQLVTRVEDGPHHVRIDQVQMEQVLLNLVLNARDAMPSGGTVTIRTAKVPAAAVAQSIGGVALTVTDDGVGMTDEVRGRAVEPFFTTKDPTRARAWGCPPCSASSNRAAACCASTAPGPGLHGASTCRAPPRRSIGARAGGPAAPRNRRPRPCSWSRTRPWCATSSCACCGGPACASSTRPTAPTRSAPRRSTAAASTC
ncbi:MAG: MASE1 domain-containing protein [Planctomycetes bacterium]|nr:MASE1 domain-containing protein [Planctomycetota bacterium]